jgi:tRNA U34 5-methylaminomethyl-2-thiouridine-forming methyltransferase MnmC
MTRMLDELVVTQDGTITLRHPAYDEDFHSIKGARFEADSLYMEASGFRSHLTTSTSAGTLGVLDVGLGLGYNALMTIECWSEGLGAQDLDLISLEHTPQLVQSLTDPACAWKEGWPATWKNWSQSLEKKTNNEAWTATFQHPLSGKKLSWRVLVGDARHADLSPWTFHYIWQDAFSPKKNPELWSVEWFEKLRAASDPSVRLVTYSVARIVRDHLEAAAWTQERLKTPQAQSRDGTGKKQWLLAQLKTT